MPLDFGRLFESNVSNLTKQKEEESIDQNLELIITTSPGEHKYDPKFGCKIWELDFERVVSKNLWEELFTQCILDAIKKYEPRIYDVSPSVTLLDCKKDDLVTGTASIRKRVDIKIDASILTTKVKCCFYYSLYLGPLSSD